MPGTPKALPSTTLAVFRPTPAGRRDPRGCGDLTAVLLGDGGAELMRNGSWPGKTGWPDDLGELLGVRSGVVGRGGMAKIGPASHY